MKRSFITFWRVFLAGCQNFIRNTWLSIAATAVMTVALTIILAGIILNVTAKNAIKELSKNLTVSVYLLDEAKADRVEELRSKLQNTPNTASVEYVSKDEAERRFAETNKGDEALLEGLALVGEGSLPASFEVSVSDIEKINDVGSIAQSDEYKDVVESVTLGKTDARKTIDRAIAAQKFITRASIIAAAIFSGVSILIIFNTIRMAIFTRSEEIKIMKLIGATPGYIRGPFIVESCLYGVIAGIIAHTTVFSAVYSLGGKVANQAEFVETYNLFTNTSIIVAIAFATVFSGMLVGVLSSALAMEKHLKLKRW